MNNPTSYCVRLLVAIVLLVASVSPVFGQLSSTLDQRLQQGPIIVDHDDVALFEQIPDNVNTDSNNDCQDDVTGNISYFCRAEKIRMIFGNRSVGYNTNESIDCLKYESDEACWENRGPGGCGGVCVKATHDDLAFSAPAEWINWYRPGGLNRTNWIHNEFAGTWYNMTDGYISLLDQDQVQGGFPLADFDVFTFQFSYLNVTDSDWIHSPTQGFFADQTEDKKDVYDLERRLVLHDNKYFIYQTASLARPIGNNVATTFNDQMRQFIQQPDSRGKYRIFLDFADIEAHTPDGVPCYDNRDGVLYCRLNGTCENHPDDGVNYPAICQHYTIETDNGHFTQGAIRVRIAKAYWVLMAQIAGWNPSTTTTPSPTPQATPTPSPLVSPSPTPHPGDLNGDGIVDLADYNVVTTGFGNSYNLFNFNAVVSGLTP